MDGVGFYGGGGVDSRKANMSIPRDSEVLLDSSIWAPDSYPPFHAMMNLERDQGNTVRQYHGQIDGAEDSCWYQPPAKKRRMSPGQVQYLQKSFEDNIKLEPNRKIQIAKDLDLEPRQVSIWFQNRKARYKYKILEKQFLKLKASYDQLQAGYDILLRENESLKNEVDKNEVYSLTEKLVQRENKIAEPNACDLIVGSFPVESQLEVPNFYPKDTMNAAQRQEDTLSDVFDSESPHCYGRQSFAALLLEDETANSWYNFGQEASGFSLDGNDDHLSRNLLASPDFPKMQDDCHGDLQPNSNNSGFLVQDEVTRFWN